MEAFKGICKLIGNNKDTLRRSHHVPVVGVEGLVNEREGVCAQFLLVTDQLGKLQEGKVRC